MSDQDALEHKHDEKKKQDMWILITMRTQE